ncbi:MAG: response regulator transcription factor [Clostridiaceae bacterium]|nr:response regulator transcription factor [Clostridiaceae bacterium]
MSSKIRVLIAEDFDIIRSEFKDIINNTDDMVVVGEAKSGAEIAELARTVPADIILMDIEMENVHAGIDAAQKIINENINVQIIFLTVHETEEMVINALSTGAADYVIKTSPPNDILEHIRNTYKGAPLLDQKIQNFMRAEFARLRRSEQSLLFFVTKLTSLTPAEKDLIRLLLKDKKVSEIAKIRSVEVVTVKTQITGLLNKFGCRRTKEIVKMLRDMKLDRFFLTDKGQSSS